jgi:hypothetical protein
MHIFEDNLGQSWHFVSKFKYHSRKSNCHCALGNFFYGCITYYGEYR